MQVEADDDDDTVGAASEKVVRDALLFKFPDHNAAVAAATKNGVAKVGLRIFPKKKEWPLV